MILLPLGLFTHVCKISEIKLQLYSALCKYLSFAAYVNLEYAANQYNRLVFLTNTPSENAICIVTTKGWQNTLASLRKKKVFVTGLYHRILTQML